MCGSQWQEKRRRRVRLTIYTVLLKRGAPVSSVVGGGMGEQGGGWTSPELEGQVGGHRQEPGTGREVSYLLLRIIKQKCRGFSCV